MNTKQIIRYYGDKPKMYEALKPLGIYRQLFDSWERKGIPLWRQRAIELATNGKLEVDHKLIAISMKRVGQLNNQGEKD